MIAETKRYAPTCPVLDEDGDGFMPDPDIDEDDELDDFEDDELDDFEDDELDDEPDDYDDEDDDL